MFGFTSLHCAACRDVRPLRFDYLVPEIASLGIKAACAECAYVAFTLIRGGRSYCPVCETLTALRVAQSSVPGKVFACCGRCDQLYAAMQTDARSTTG
jgi:hypothetical protein